MRLMDEGGQEIGATAETEARLAPNQTRAVKSYLPWTPASKVKTFSVELDVVDVPGHKELSPPFWVRVEQPDPPLVSERGRAMMKRLMRRPRSFASMRTSALGCVLHAAERR